MTLDRRTLLVAATALMAAPRASARPQPAKAARIQPVVDDYFGTRVTDPYRWMEDPQDPDWLPYLESQNAATRSALDAIPGRAALAQKISALSGDTAVTSRVKPVGELLFYEQRPAGADNFKLFVRGSDGHIRLLIDPTMMKMGGAHVSLDWWEPSFDARHIVYGLSAAGSEASICHVMEVVTAKLLPERIPNTDYGVTGWLPDSSGFLYTVFVNKRGTPEFYLDSELRLHRLGADPKTDTLVLKRGLYAELPMERVQLPSIQTLPGSDIALVTVSDIRQEKAIWTGRLAGLIAGKPMLTQVAGFDDLVTSAAVAGDDLYLLAHRGAIRGRVLKTSLTRPDLTAAREVVPQGPTVIERLSSARDGVYVTIMDGGVQRLARLAGGRVAAIDLPFEGTIGGVFTTPEHDGAYLWLAGWLEPSGIWRVGADGSVTDTGLNPRPPIDTAPYEARRGFASAKDGVKIPYTLLYRKGLTLNGANPVLVTAYGAYQLPLTPQFSSARLPFLDDGGVYCVAHVRGGGEYGREWHKGGQKQTKANTWRDLIAVCEGLIAAKVTSPARLAIMGGSAGGITVGRALTERPELFAAAISDVGWTNPIRYTAEQNVSDIEEWGPMIDAKSFRIIYDMDAYQAIRDAVSYPAVLCMTGVTDPRVAPWHVAKFAARLQAATVSGNPVLLRVDFDAGHGIGSTRSQRIAMAADVYAFVLWRTGAKRYQPG
ncbi:prolyl oligopeptidase family serine peptidase [Paucibacter sp. M5-1]|uniref:prolyl oligopeptidase family serine peptidase n=1 Tax=Paucibacter sp. M5-1 TaxID=3015998 RepID=UPI0022B93B70|nr:prolyl oligopeptidase family serine peptidase [Paucibacter sp. M5-1]MCZ7880387.1 prolyl oligopeptidase family serine peptidase [Paucibacter sp. M5-1]